jgi:hypothetical protein
VTVSNSCVPGLMPASGTLRTRTRILQNHTRR